MICYLHIGTGKTGTTTIQKFLANNRDALLKQGYLYPQSPGGRRHYRLSFYSRDDASVSKMGAWISSGSTDIKRERRNFESQFKKEVISSGVEKAILSDEALDSLKGKDLDKLQEFLYRVFSRVIIVVYLRPQDQLLPSRYQQSIKQGSTQTIEEYLEFIKGRPESAYEYYAKLERWSSKFGKGNIRVRIFARDEFVGGQLLDDFLYTIDLPTFLDDRDKKFAESVRSSTTNRSLDATRVEFLRRLNKHLNKIEPGPKRVGFRKEINRSLIRYSDGPVLIPSVKEISSFRQIFEPSNRKVAIQFLGRADGMLFRNKQKPRGRESTHSLTLELCIKISYEVCFQIWNKKQREIIALRRKLNEFEKEKTRRISLWLRIYRSLRSGIEGVKSKVFVDK